MRKIINIKEPDISNIERREVLKCLKKSEISTYGSLVSEIGKKLNVYNKSKYNLTLNSGTAALQLGFKAAGVCEGDIVITQSFTFGATFIFTRVFQSETSNLPFWSQNRLSCGSINSKTTENGSKSF